MRRWPCEHSVVRFLLDDFASNLPQLLHGLRISALLTGGALAIGLPLALLAALAQMSAVRGLRAGAVVFVEVGRGAPAWYFCNWRTSVFQVQGSFFLPSCRRSRP